MTGKDITVTLSQGGVALANTRIRSNDIKTHCNTIEKASSEQQQWANRLTMRKSWSLNVSYLVLVNTQVADLLYVGQTFDVAIKSDGSDLLTGKAIMTDVSNVATVGNLAQGSFSLRGNGALVSGSGPTPPPPTPTDYSKEYLTFEAIEAGTFTLTIPAGVTSSQISSVSYSTDDGDTWTTVSNNSTEVSVTTPSIAAGSKVKWKGSGSRYGTSATNYCKFSATGAFNASGNIMSLIYGDSFVDQVTIGYQYEFFGLFYGNTKVVSAENLILPATTLLNSCYRNMFYGCSALTTGPSLPASTLVDNCYRGMFYNCSSLSKIVCLATSISASNCTSSWVGNVSATGTFVKASSMTGWSTGTGGIPSGWAVENA